MFERAVNVFWILLGAAAATYSWSLGLIGPSGPDTGLFPFLAAVIIMGTGVVLVMQSAIVAGRFEFPRGAALGRVLGVTAGLAVMAAGMSYAGFAVTGTVTMIILLRTVERTSWVSSIALAVISVGVTIWLFGHFLGMALPRGPWGW